VTNKPEFIDKIRQFVENLAAFGENLL